jgi:SAM-dependent methyltransferase
VSSMIELARQATVEVGDQLAETIASYNATAHRYALRFGGVDMGQYLERFVSMLPSGRATVLDAGCGTGRDYRWFAARGIDVLGIDLSGGLLEQAREVCRGRFVQGDLRDLPLEKDSVDGVWACASLVHLPMIEVSKAFAQFGAVLRPGGALFVSVRHGEGGEWRPDGDGGRRYFHLHRPQELGEELARRGFTLESLAVERGVVAGQWLNVYARVAA